MIRPKQPHKKCQFERPVAKYDETTAFCMSKQEKIKRIFLVHML